MPNQAIAGLAAGGMLYWFVLWLGLVGLVAVGVVWRLLGRGGRRDEGSRSRRQRPAKTRPM